MYDENIYFEIELECPICGHSYKSLKTKGKNPNNIAMGHEIYLLPIYSDELSNPLSYELDSCPKCFYTVFHSDFKDKKNNAEKNTINTFRKEIKTIGKDIPKKIYYRNNFVARQLYLLSAYVYNLSLEKDNNKLGKCYIRAAWYSKELKDIDMYKICLKKALDIYIASFSETSNPEMSAIIMYIISSLYYEIGDFESAVPYLNKINGDMTSKKIPIIKQPLEDLTLNIRKELKEIELKRKNMSVEDKKKDRLNILESVKAKQYIEPLGSQVELIDLQGLEKEDEKEELLSDKTKVVIIDSSKSYFKMLNLTVENHCEVIGIYYNWIEFENSLKKNIPKFVLVDLSEDTQKNLLSVRSTSRENRDIKFIGFGRDNSQEFIMDIFSYGISNYILKPVDRNKLIKILKKS